MAQADSGAAKFVASIHSVEQVKHALREEMNADCRSGTCASDNAARICNWVGGLDAKSGGAISRPAANVDAKAALQLAAPDAELFKRIWKQCKPSSFGYWNRDTILRVEYQPEPGEGPAIRKALGL